MENEKDINEATGNKQSDFAGTNPDKYGQPKYADDLNPNDSVDMQEAQNISSGSERMTEEDAEHAKNKATQRGKQ